MSAIPSTEVNFENDECKLNILWIEVIFIIEKETQAPQWLTVVPVNKPIRLAMRSHSMLMPEFLVHFPLGAGIFACCLVFAGLHISHPSTPYLSLSDFASTFQKDLMSTAFS